MKLKCVLKKLMKFMKFLKMISGVLFMINLVMWFLMELVVLEFVGLDKSLVLVLVLLMCLMICLVILWVVVGVVVVNVIGVVILGIILRFFLRMFIWVRKLIFMCFCLWFVKCVMGLGLLRVCN